MSLKVKTDCELRGAWFILIKIRRLKKTAVFSLVLGRFSLDLRCSIAIEQS